MITNLTPHPIVVICSDAYHNETKVIIPPYGKVARVETSTQCDGWLMEDGVPIPLYRTEMGAVIDLPPPQDGVMLIVSSIVRGQRPLRNDLLSPSGLVRDANGNVIGCQGLSR